MILLSVIILHILWLTHMGEGSEPTEGATLSGTVKAVGLYADTTLESSV